MLYYNRIDISERIDVMTELTFLKELMLIRGVNQKKIVTIGIFRMKSLSFNQMSAADAMMSMNLRDIVILNIKGAVLLLYY